ncbi:RIP metalloprotease RseP [Rhodoferax sp. PAMC 29310]|uniref:RIP metalloprotease RseP n=1 Tax=Rhodoferax sp. PAMC 29310 TaxID=2822760 RepID=UPI001B34206A|nr:RIP metalloprotease RseP [Rhodoferax sp. PAMC 29310]
MMLTALAFVVAIALLIAVHEYGHYRMAVAVGVRVIRFSIGFGPQLLRWQPNGSPTEFVVCMLPLGGYVKMLDEREAPVAPELQHMAFNRQPLKSKVAIVAAGPAANLLLAVFLYAVVNWNGVQYPAAVLASPAPESMAAQSGIEGGERVLRAALAQDALSDIGSFEDVRWFLTRGALDGLDVRLELSNLPSGPNREVLLRLSELDSPEASAQLFQSIGVSGPYTRPVLGEILPDGAANRAGLREGDLVRRVGDVPIVDGQQLRQMIRKSGSTGIVDPKTWSVERRGALLQIVVRPEVRQEGALHVGKIGAFVGSPPELVTVEYGAIDGLWHGVLRTWDVSALTLKMIGRMLVGEASLKNLSGPLTIAEYAGKSAGIGLTQYLLFLALISVSLGVLNLLPLPVLDGGHLMYYLWESIVGVPVSDVWMERLQRGGIAVLLIMMSIAFFNDISRLFG